MNANDLVAEHFKLKDQLETWNKKYADFIKPTQTRMEEIKNELHALLNQQGGKAIKTEHGTASTSVITTPGISDREAYLDFVEQNWTEHGNAMLQLSAPQVTAVKEYMEAHNGALPPGVKISTYTRINITKS